MSRFPLVALELRRSSRSPAIFAMRIVPTFICALAMLGTWGIWYMVDASPTEGARNASNVLGAVSIFFQIVIVFFAAPLFTAPAIARERQDRTLQLLYLAQLGRADVYIAKFIGAFFNAEMMLISLLPIGAFTALLGGVSLQALLAQVAIMSCIAAVTTAMALFASSLSQRPFEAYFWSMVLIGVLYGAEHLSSLAPWSNSVPQLVVLRAMTQAFADIPNYTFLAVACLECLIITIVFAALTLLVLRRVSFQPPTARRTRLSQILSPNLILRWPAARLYHASLEPFGGKLFQMPYVLPLALAFCALVFFAPWLEIAIPLLIFYEIASTTASSRASGALELQFLTTTRDAELTRAALASHLLRSSFLWPAIVLQGFVSVYAMLSVSTHTVYVEAMCYGLTLTKVILEVFEYTAIGLLASTWSGKPVRQTLVGFLAYCLASALLLMFIGCPASLIAQLIAISAPIDSAILMNFALPIPSSIILIFIALFDYHRTISTQWRKGKMPLA